MLHGFTEKVLCECGAEMKAAIGLPFVIWGPGMAPHLDKSLAERNLQHPNVVAGLKSGKYEIEKTHDWREGFGSSSSIQVRAEEGSL